MRHALMRRGGNISNLTIIDNAPVPQPQRRQVRVKMITAGVSFPDLQVVRGKYPAGQPPFPLVPGIVFSFPLDLSFFLLV
jgi:NADPH:quinone reductase-like Zn-dependent oxidoreductase